MTYPVIHDGFKERGFVIYEGQGKLQTGIFRVANMGHLTLDDFRRFLVVLEELLHERKSGIPLSPQGEG
jgi:2-aminoethylphosphonate-pyruvate transaminase